jgi:endonuclease/exonuclease/phosphatase family metal-dependent hydrolase
MLLVDLDVPEAPGHAVTVVSTHLENRAKPKIRRQQMEELLKQIHDIAHPVIVAGDLNTSGSDSTPTSIENMLYKPVWKRGLLDHKGGSVVDRSRPDLFGYEGCN